MKTMKIYLAGKVPKGHDIGAFRDWREEYAHALRAYSSDIEFLSPEDPSLDESQPLVVFGHDCYLLRACDVAMVAASEKLGVGTAQEMLIAKYFAKPVITVLPRDTHHRRTNLKMHAGVVADWIHPFIYSTSDVVVETLEEAGAWLKAFRNSDNAQFKVKDLHIIEECMTDYERFLARKKG